MNNSIKSVLVIPNITFQKELEQDSFVKVMSEIISSFQKFSKMKLWFHIPLPKYCKSLDFENVTQYFIEFPTYPNSMRGHFNHYDWLKIIDWKNQDFDIVYSHLPEQTLNVTNLLANVTNIGTIPVIGYCHWTETKDFATYDKNFLLNNINGVLEMNSCGYNTQNQIDDIIKEVSNIYSDKTIQKLKNIMQPIYLGIDGSDKYLFINDSPKRVIVFNHRQNSYRKFDFFIEAIKLLREKRQDFDVWCSMSDNVDLDYVKSFPLPDKESYYKELNNSYIGVVCGNRWAVSVQDGLSNGLPYVFEDTPELNELFAGNTELSNNLMYSGINGLVNILDKLLSDSAFRNKMAQKSLNFSNSFYWENKIQAIEKQFSDAFDSKKAIKKSDRKDDIVSYIKKMRQVSKSQLMKHLGWGVGIKFANYRKYIMDNPNIEITRFPDKIFEGDFHNKQTEYYVWKD